MSFEKIGSKLAPAKEAANLAAFKLKGQSASPSMTSEGAGVIERARSRSWDWASRAPKITSAIGKDKPIDYNCTRSREERR